MHRTRRLILCGAICALLNVPSHAALEGYWPLDIVQGDISPNLVESGTDAQLFNGFALVDDGVRGQVLTFDGVDAYANAGTIPALTLESDFTWSFWSFNEEPAPVPPAGPTNTLIIGNRYDISGANSNPLEFIKFTNAQFEVHQNNTPENINYPDMPVGQWVYNTVVKDGDRLLAYRDGVVIGSRTLTGTPINSQPLYFGGDRDQENWTGRLDDVAIWTDALPAASVRALARGEVNPQTASTVAPTINYSTVFSEDFSGTIDAKWFESNRGLETNAEAGYDAPSTAGGVLSLGGNADIQYWAGKSVETIDTFSSSEQTLVSVDRVSISGGGTGGTPEAGRYRSSLWILGDDSHYFHLSQNVNEGGWSWNFEDEGGIASTIATGAGANLPGLDALDTDFGNHKLQLELIPLGEPGDVLISAYVDGMLVATQEFSAFPDEFRVVLTGQARAIDDFVDAQFDNVLVQQVPEPSTALLLGGALVGFAMRRRRK